MQSPIIFKSNLLVVFDEFTDFIDRVSTLVYNLAGLKFVLQNLGSVDDNVVPEIKTKFY